MRDLREMGVGWVRDGCDVQAKVVACGGGAGDDGAAMARAARCGDARRIFCCHLGDGRGGTVGFPRKRNSARFTASNRHFSPVFLCFFTLAPADGLGARFSSALAVITPSLVCQTQNKIISKRFTRFASFFCSVSASACLYNALREGFNCRINNKNCCFT